MNLYICHQGAQISINENQFHIKKTDDTYRAFPIHMIEMMEIFGNVQITTQAVKRCLQEGIPIVYYTLSGRMVGQVSAPSRMHPEKVLKQYHLLEHPETLLAIDKSIVRAKLHNQRVVLRRFMRKRSDALAQETEALFTGLLKRVDRAVKRDQLMGIEGIAAREYFRNLGMLPEELYRFTKRTRRPSKDPVNAALNMGYSILLNEVLGVISGAGLMPEIGIFHVTGYNRPALACDLMEEWRPIIVDSTVIAMFTGHEFQEEDFQKREEGVYLTPSGLKKLIRKLQMKMDLSCSYLKTSERKLTFHNAIAHQVFHFCKLLESGRAEEYQPIMLR